MNWQDQLTEWNFKSLDQARVQRAQTILDCISPLPADPQSLPAFKVHGYVVKLARAAKPGEFGATCACPDFKTHQMAILEPCKHIIALAMHLEKAGGLPPTETVPPPSDGWPAAALRIAVGNAIARLTDLIGAFLLEGESPLIIGPTGVGKTSAIHRVAEALDLGLEEMAGSESWTEADLIGCWTPAREWSWGPIGRAFDRARRGESLLIFVDEITRFNPRATDILLRTLQPVTADRARRMGIELPPATGPVFLAEAPLLGYRAWAPAGRIAWVAAGNPNINPLDPALVRRFAVAEARLDRGILDALPAEIRPLIDALWTSYEQGELPLPIEYQALTHARSTADLFHSYLSRLRALDPVAAEAVVHLCKGHDVEVTP